MNSKRLLENLTVIDLLKETWNK